jgi:hypothetical protein
MNSDQLQRMARWLAYLEPKFFEIDMLNNGNLLKKSATLVHDFIIDDTSVDQHCLFGTCFDAAIARGWQPSLQATKSEFEANIIYADSPVKGVVSSDYEPGIAMAKALFYAHGALDWETTDPPEVKS